MSANLIVENFGPIQKAELELKKTTVLIGPQGSGKSTLAKLAAIAKEASNSLFIEDVFRKKIQDFGMSSFENAHTKISYINDDQSKVTFDANNADKITVSHPKLVSLLGSIIPKHEVEIILREAGKETLKTLRELGKEDLVQKLQEALQKFQEMKGHTVKYLPAERFFISTTSGAQWGLIANDIALPRFVSLFGSDFEKAKRSIKQLNVDFLGISYRFENGEDKVFHRNDSKGTKLSESASGYQAIIPLMSVIEFLCQESQSGYSAIVDEPELNLYPITQKELIYFLAGRCADYNAELWMSTHSPYVLSALNNLLFAYQVSQKHPQHHDEISSIIPKNCWLNPEDFAVYHVAEGTVRSIFDSSTGLIAENELDHVSELLGEEFDHLMDIYVQKNYAPTA